MVRDRRDRLIDRSTIMIERDIFDTSMQTTDRRTISPRMTMWFSSTGEDESTELDLYPMSKESERFLREEGSELKKRKKKLILSVTMVPERISVNHCSAFRSIRVRGSGLTFELTDSYSARVRE